MYPNTSKASRVTRYRIRITKRDSQIHFLFLTPDVTINDIQIPRNIEIKYLEMTIDSKLTWKQHIAKKRKQVNITIKQ
jgi:hypothetical protein